MDNSDSLQTIECHQSMLIDTIRTQKFLQAILKKVKMGFRTGLPLSINGRGYSRKQSNQRVDNEYSGSTTQPIKTVSQKLDKNW